MHQADADHPARLGEAEAPHQLDGVVVAIPDADAARGKMLGHGARAVVIDRERDGGHALVDPPRIGDAANPEPGHGGQRAEQRADQAALVLADRHHRRAQ